MDILSILISAVIGLAAGYIAKRIMPGKDVGEGNIWVTMLIGVLGGIVGSVVAGLLGLAVGGIIWNIILAVLGSMLLLWLYKKFIAK